MRLLDFGPSRPLPALLVVTIAAIAATSACHGGGTVESVGGVGGCGGVCGGAAFAESEVSTATATAGTGMPPPTDVCPVGPLPGSPCSPGSPACGPGSLCLSNVDQSTATVFGLRMAQLDLTLPAAFTHGALPGLLATSMLPDDAACNLDGMGTFSWLLRFDTVGGTLTTGAAPAMTDPAAGFAFDDETIPSGSTSFHVAPAMLTAGVSPECAFTSSAGDVVLPVFADTSGSVALLLPLHQVAFTNGRLSADNGCIGRYDPQALDPSTGCKPNDPHPAFVDGADVAGFIVLEEADTVAVPPLDESLCALLADDPGYVSPSNSGAVCKRAASGDILFKGDWCAATNAQATPGCADAVRFSGSFAAIGVKMQ